MQKILAASLAVLSLTMTACTPAVQTPSPIQGTSSSSGESLGALEAKANAGDPQSMFILGAMYHDGQGVVRDFAKALQYFEAAGRLDERRAQYNAGLMYLRGEGMRKDMIAARRWFERSADLGNPRAIYQMALFSYLGEGGSRKNAARAAELFTQAALLGVPDAQYNAGIVSIRGEGVQQNLPAGYAWLTIAKENNYPKAADALTQLEKSLTPAMREEGDSMVTTLKTTIEKTMREANIAEDPATRRL